MHNSVDRTVTNHLNLDIFRIHRGLTLWKYCRWWTIKLFFPGVTLTRLKKTYILTCLIIITWKYHILSGPTFLVIFVLLFFFAHFVLERALDQLGFSWPHIFKFLSGITKIFSKPQTGRHFNFLDHPNCPYLRMVFHAVLNSTVCTINNIIFYNRPLRGQQERHTLYLLHNFRLRWKLFFFIWFEFCNNTETETVNLCTKQLICKYWD